MNPQASNIRALQLLGVHNKSWRFLEKQAAICAA
jgi:hypothetical protein